MEGVCEKMSDCSDEVQRSHHSFSSSVKRLFSLCLAVFLSLPEQHAVD